MILVIILLFIHQNFNIMKHRFHLTAMCAVSMAVLMALSSCEKIIFPSEDDEEVSNQRTFTFSLFTPSTTRASSVADFQTVIILDIKDGTVAQIVRQSASDANFGNPSITLANGQHTLRFFATDARNTSFTSNVATQSPLGDTFVKSLAIDTKTSEANQRVVLERVVARVKWVSEGSVTVHGILSNFNLLTNEPVGEGSTITLNQDEETYSLIPASGYLSLSDGISVPIRANSLTILDADGSGVNPGDDTPREDELLVYTNDTAQFYVPKMEIKGITLNKIPDPRTTYANQMKPYRMPTRIEAAAMRTYVLPSDYWSGARCLCYDRPEDYRIVGTTEYGTGKYYTFTWSDSNTGGTTVAGEKTTYSIKPIRVIPLSPLAMQISLDADFTWNTDTTKVNVTK